MYRFSVNAFPSPDDYKDPRANALLNTSFEGLPPCLLIVADLDPLRDDNLGMKNYQ
jgi:acetyl esterase/lipase